MSWIRLTSAYVSLVKVQNGLAALLHDKKNSKKVSDNRDQMTTGCEKEKKIFFSVSQSHYPAVKNPLPMKQVIFSLKSSKATPGGINVTSTFYSSHFHASTVGRASL